AGLAVVSGRAGEVVVLFGSVLAHELGHSLVGRLFGLRLQRITLYPFGGVAELAGLERASPRARLATLVAGPLVSLLLFLAGGWLAGQAGPESPWGRWGGSLHEANRGLLVANLLPVGPLDGGRMVEVALERRAGAGVARRRLVGAGVVGGGWGGGVGVGGGGGWAGGGGRGAGGGLGGRGVGGVAQGPGLGELPLAGGLPGRGRPAGGKDHPLCGAPLGLGRAPPPHLGARPASGRAAGGPSLGGGRPPGPRALPLGGGGGPPGPGGGVPGGGHPHGRARRGPGGGPPGRAPRGAASPTPRRGPGGGRRAGRGGKARWWGLSG